MIIHVRTARDAPRRHEPLGPAKDDLPRLDLQLNNTYTYYLKNPKAENRNL
jgi:hypothetical protein